MGSRISNLRIPEKIHVETKNGSTLDVFACVVACGLRDRFAFADEPRTG